MSRTILLVCLSGLCLLAMLAPSLRAGETNANDLFAPVFVNRPQSLQFDHCDTARYTFQAVSAATGLPSIWVRYRLVSGPGVIDSMSGEWKLGPISNPDSIGTYVLEVGASEFGLQTEGPQNCRVLLQIYSYVSPLYSNDPDFQGRLDIEAGQTAHVEFEYYSASRCDSAWSYLAGVTPEFAGSIDYQDFSRSSVLTVRPDSADAGRSFQIQLKVTNGTSTNSTRITVRVLPDLLFAVKIQVRDTVLQGGFTEIPVTLGRQPSGLGLGGFDFLIAYDNSALSLQTVVSDSSPLYSQCKWEYFTFRFGANGNCGASCLSGLVRVVGLGETNNGAAHPLCYSDNFSNSTIEMFRMKFLVSNNRTLECTFVPIRFFWNDCSDNTLSSSNGSALHLAKAVYNYSDSKVTLDSTPPAFPGYDGVPTAACIPDPQFGRVIDQMVAFHNGGLDIICAESIDARCVGDINLDLNPNQMGDYVRYQNYFLYGLPALGLVQYSLGCTDVNGDGVPLTLADLIYLNLIGRGVALPYPKNPPDTSTNLTSIGQSDIPANWVLVSTADTLGALDLVYRGNVSFDHWRTGLTWRSSFDGDSTHLLISPPDFDSFPKITTGWIMRAAPVADSTKPAELLKVEAVTYTGHPVRVQFGVITDIKDRIPTLPLRFSLRQNYPNPFNAGTTIWFDLPRSSAVSVEVINVLGQVVWTTSGQYAAGSHKIEWNGSSSSGRSVSSGVYYYRLRAGEYVETRKMVLLK